MSKLPVKVIIRLCTNDEKVINMYNDMDDKFASIDVMDDYWGEVRRKSKMHASRFASLSTLALTIFTWYCSSKFSSVLHSLYAKAMEVYLHNPW